MNLKTITIERLAFGAQGIGRVDGKVVFVPGVLPGETVDIEITASKADYLEAVLLHVIEGHPDRTTPPCPLYMNCGGCQLQHAAYSIQPGLKAAAALEGMPQASRSSAATIASVFPYFYRDRVRFQIGKMDGRQQLGFHAFRTNRLIPVPFCHLLHPRLNEILPALNNHMVDLPEDSQATGLSVQVGQPECGFHLVVDFNTNPDAKALRWLNGLKGVVKATAQYTLKGKPQKKTSGKPALPVRPFSEMGLSFHTLPGVFTQVNPDINRSLIRAVIHAATETGALRALDLYAGFGNFSLPLAKVVRNVKMVEDSPAAVANARFNLQKNEIKNVEVVKGDAVRTVEQLAVKGEKFDLIVLDPPRAGARGLAAHAARLGSREIIYISCHPAAMVRDLAEFASMGYSTKSLTALDMFPQTAHLEVMARMSRG